MVTGTTGSFFAIQSRTQQYVLGKIWIKVVHNYSISEIAIAVNPSMSMRET